MPFATLCFLASVALLAGWLGGVGGRAWRDRHRYAETEERFEALERRLSRREGVAGQERKRKIADDGMGDLAELARLAGAGRPGAGGAPQLVPLDPVALEAESARRHKAK